MPEPTQVTNKGTRWQRLRGILAPVAILLVAGGIVAVIAGNWNKWTSNRTAQKTDDAYVRADLTPLSTKVAGLVARVAVSDYQTVKAVDILVALI
jgi:membrane fusion protein (multidrug efflux system)